VSDLRVAALDVSTWPACASLIERHHGIWSGCWCTWFHDDAEKDGTEAGNRALKERLVREGRAHAAVVLDDEECVGWCQYGSPAELPNQKSAKEYRKHLVSLPDWRITCFFVDRTRRRQGIANLALEGALDLIGRQGGGRIEAYPETVSGRKTSGSFLFNGTVEMFEAAGFTRDRRIAMHRWVMVRDVGPDTSLG
jgi:GNAT superfamily N-acetyltransferase